ncbi:GNAT family N-acetyltransferase [Agrobacterium rubi]|nr:GNAT family N-acetyltransferase [Agrobacterium rubi]NTE86715.1 GNAT family N-acetyltransferase [Agrobacterium rubi]
MYFPFLPFVTCQPTCWRNSSSGAKNRSWHKMPVSNMLRAMRKVDSTVPRLVSRRLTLRPFSVIDAPALARITNDPLVLRNLLRTSSPFTVDDARTRILRFRKNNLPVWAIDKGQLIGLIGLAGEFGLWLARSAWGKGYGEEASRLIIDHAFTQRRMTTLHANPISNNRASYHLMEKLGFRDVGRMQSFCRQRKMVVSLRRYELKNVR